MKYVVLGPDGIPISGKHFATRADAERGVGEFIKRFQSQGYYAGVGYRLSLHQIAARCTVEAVASKAAKRNS
jgi:hypothetical protein